MTNFLLTHVLRQGGHINRNIAAAIAAGALHHAREAVGRPAVAVHRHASHLSSCEARPAIDWLKAAPWAVAVTEPYQLRPGLRCCRAAGWRPLPPGPTAEPALHAAAEATVTAGVIAVMTGAMFHVVSGYGNRCNSRSAAGAVIFHRTLPTRGGCLPRDVMVAWAGSGSPPVYWLRANDARVRALKLAETERCVKLEACSYCWTAHSM
ncbi:hypothetical protein KCP73_17265 [Salmonella enterica subsp. enterica]|nr:hypothetical protein KCP73_17265 [Salmonella enterica subsp. enterica]